MVTISTVNILDEDDIQLIHNAALNILSDVGVQVDSRRMLKILGEHGASVNLNEQRVRFPKDLMNRFLAESEKMKVETPPNLHTFAGGESIYYLPPDSNRAEPFTMKTIGDFTRLVDSPDLDNIDSIIVVGTPSDVPKRLIPLYMRLNCWKWAERKPCNTYHVYDIKQAPFVVKMCKVMAEAKGKSFMDYFAAGTYMISPLKVAAPQAEILLYFWKRRLPCSLGTMTNIGGTAPVTLSGAMALALAESLFCNFVSRALYGTKKLGLSASPMPLDLKYGWHTFGRPEMILTLLAGAQIARHYGASNGGGGNLCDAKLPSCEAEMQKAMSALAAIMAGSRSIGYAGGLATGHILSPVQAVIDNEFFGYLKKIVRGFQVNAEELALDVVRKIGPGGSFIGTMHTVKNYRRSLWYPRIFSQMMYNTWVKEDGKTDSEKALDICLKVLDEYHPLNIDEDTEARLLGVIEEARKKIYG